MEVRWFRAGICPNTELGDAEQALGLPAWEALLVSVMQAECGRADLNYNSRINLFLGRGILLSMVFFTFLYFPFPCRVLIMYWRIPRL